MQELLKRLEFYAKKSHDYTVEIEGEELVIYEVKAVESIEVNKL